MRIYSFLLSFLLSVLCASAAQKTPYFKCMFHCEIHIGLSAETVGTEIFRHTIIHPLKYAAENVQQLALLRLYLSGEYRFDYDCLKR